MSNLLRCFLAHPKDCEDAEIDLLKGTAESLLTQQIRAHGGTVIPAVITGRDDFNDRVMMCGGWDDWAASVVEGTGYVDGALRTLYDLIVVSPHAIVGKATAQMIERALSNADPGKRKPVFYMPHPEAEDGNKLYPVVAITKREVRDFKRSHSLQFLQPI